MLPEWPPSTAVNCCHPLGLSSIPREPSPQLGSLVNKARLIKDLKLFPIGYRLLAKLNTQFTG